MDDSYLQGSTKEKCLENVHDTIVLLQSLGFTIHPDKSIFEPAQKNTFLGFIIDSITMTITLTTEKKEKISNICQDLIESKKPTIRSLAKVIGNLVASFPAVKYGKLHYRNLENEKIASLKAAHQNFNGPALLSKASYIELAWWVANVYDTFNNVVTQNPDVTIFTDASLLGWGITDGNKPSGGRWHSAEIKNINFLELKVIIHTYCSNNTFKHVRVMCDNTTAVSYINHMGGIKSSL